MLVVVHRDRAAGRAVVGRDRRHGDHGQPEPQRDRLGRVQRLAATQPDDDPGEPTGRTLLGQLVGSGSGDLTGQEADAGCRARSRAAVACSRSPSRSRTNRSVTTSGRATVRRDHLAEQVERARALEVAERPGEDAQPGKVRPRRPGHGATRGRSTPYFASRYSCDPHSKKPSARPDPDHRPQHAGVEHRLGHQRRQAAGRLVVLGDDQPVVPARELEHRLGVERLDRRHVQHAGVDAAPGRGARGVERPLGHVARGRSADRAVALAQPRRLARTNL